MKKMFVVFLTMLSFLSVLTIWIACSKKDNLIAQYNVVKI